MAKTNFFSSFISGRKTRKPTKLRERTRETDNESGNETENETDDVQNVSQPDASTIRKLDDTIDATVDKVTTVYLAYQLLLPIVEPYFGALKIRIKILS